MILSVATWLEILNRLSENRLGQRDNDICKTTSMFEKQNDDCLHAEPKFVSIICYSRLSRKLLKAVSSV